MGNDLKFKRLIEQYQKGLLAPRDEALMDAFMETLARESSADSNPDWSESDKLALKVRILSCINQPTATLSWRDGKLVALRWFQVAAAVSLLMLFSYWVSRQWLGQFDEPVIQNITEQCEPGKIKKVMLSDGTLIWLKGRSSIIYPERFGRNIRSVTLFGDALFEVTKNPQSPFTVKCSGLDVRVVGTSFSIRSDSAGVELLVLSGKVLASTQGNSQSLEVLPHQKVIYNEVQQALKRVTAPEQEEAAATANTEYSMAFEDTPMNEIIHRLESKFNVLVELSNERLKHCVITVDLTDQSLVQTLDIMARTLKFEYKIESHHITLSGEGCNPTP
jgi:transmembrane sensor